MLLTALLLRQLVERLSARAIAEERKLSLRYTEPAESRARCQLFAIEDLRRVGWQLFTPASYTGSCGHPQEIVPIPEAGDYCWLIPVVGEAGWGRGGSTTNNVIVTAGTIDIGSGFGADWGPLPILPLRETGACRNRSIST